MEKKSQKPIRVRIAEKLIKDQQELDHLAVQVSLGKAEMNDEFKKLFFIGNERGYTYQSYYPNSPSYLPIK